MVAVTEPKPYTVPEVAAHLQVSERTVLNWLRAGKLRGYRLGGPKAGWRIEVADLEQFKNQQRGG